MGKTIGIDLGTTNSVISYLDNGEAKIIPNSNGNNLTPSVVAFSKTKEVLVGEVAKNQLITNSARTVLNIKRKMGEDFGFFFEGKRFRPEQISSFILSKLKSDAEGYLKERVTDAVITVPAYFNDAARQATIDAGTLAGLNVLRIINEPTSAALAYGINNIKINVLIYDLGGGTFDVSILEIEGGVFEVKSTKGDNKLGGIDFNNRLRKMIIEQFEEESGIDLSFDKYATQKIDEEVEKAKIVLSEKTFHTINIPFISADANGPKHLKFSITRSEFEKIIEDLVERTIDLTAEALREASFDIDDIDKIIMVGGSTYVPLVRNRLSKFVNRDLKHVINPDEIVALGAAIQGGIINGEIDGVVLLDITPLSLGIEIDGGLFVPVIPRNSPIPMEAKKIFTTVVDNQEEVEVHILQGESKNSYENMSLGKFILTKIRKEKKGVPKIEVTFDINVDSIVRVTARDIDTLQSAEIIVNSKCNLSKEELELFTKEEYLFDNVETISHLSNSAKELIIKFDLLKKEIKIDNDTLNEIDELVLKIYKMIDEENISLLKTNINILKELYEELLIMSKTTDDILIEENCLIS